jgi:hypothetical protein
MAYLPRLPPLTGSAVLAIAAASWSVGAVPLAGQRQTDALGGLSGQVIDAGTGRVVSGAAVDLAATYPTMTVFGLPVDVPMDRAQARQRGAGEPRRVLTGADGTFTFTDLLPGRYQIVARRAGYAVAAYGRRGVDDSSRLVTLQPGEHLGGLTVLAWKLGTIAGRVIDEFDQPAVGIEVLSLRATPAGGGIRYEPASYTSTDDAGSFRLPDLRPGEYLVAVPSKTITIPAPVAPHGELDVDPLVWQSEAASRSGAPVPFGDEQRVGDFFIGWRGMEGRLSVEHGATRVLVYPTAFVPGAERPGSAGTIALESGSVMTVDLRLRAIDSVSVSGRLLGPDGHVGGIGLRLTAVEFLKSVTQQGIEAGWTATRADGTFTFLGVPPGEYRLSARVGTNFWAPGPGTPGFRLLGLTALGGAAFRPPIRPATEPLLWADANVTVADRDVTGVALSLEQGFRLQGRIEFEGTADLPTERAMSSLIVQLRPLDSPRQSVSAAAPVGLEFSTASYPPGRYQVVVRNPDRTWRISSILADGRERFDAALDLSDRNITDAILTFTDRETNLSGSVVLEQPDSQPSVTVVAFPADVERWIAGGMIPRVSWDVPADHTGHFAIRNMKPGDYFLAALSSDATADLQDSGFVRAVAREAVRLTVKLGNNLAPLLRVLDVR